MAGLFELANPALASVPEGRLGLALAPEYGAVQQQGIEQMLGGLGVKSRQAQMQDILSKIDMNDPNSMILASSELMKLGMTAEAQQLMKAAQEAQLDTVKIGSEEALIGQRNALANKYGAEVQETLTGKSKTYQIDAAIAQVERLLKDGKITQEQANVAYMNLLKANPELTQAEVVAKQRQGLPTVYNAAGIGQGEIGYASPEEVGKLAEALKQGGAGSVKGITNKPLHQLLNVTPEQFGKVLSGGGQASSYAMGAQQKFAEGDVDGARVLWNQALQAKSIASDETVDIKDEKIFADINKATEDLTKQELTLAQIINITNDNKNLENPKLMQPLASQLVSGGATTAIRALAEVEGLRKEAAVIDTVSNLLSKIATGTATNEEILRYKDAATQLKLAVEKNKQTLLSNKVNQYSSTSLLKSEAKVPSFLGSFGVRDAKYVGDDTSGKPNGSIVRAKDGVYVVVNGKVYKGSM